MIAVQQKVVGAGNARRSGADHGDPHGSGKMLGDKIAAETQGMRPSLVVRDVTLQRFDADRFVDQVAPAGHFAESHANAPAGRGHRIFLQDDAERMFGFSVADVIDVLRDIDLGRACFGAWRRDVDHAVLVRLCAGSGFQFELVAKILQRRQQRACAGLPKPAKRRIAHLSGQRNDVAETERALFAVPQRVERIANEHRAHPAGGAFAAGLLSRLLHIAPEHVDQADAGIQNEKAAIAYEGSNPIVVVEDVEFAQRDDGLFRAGLFRTVVVDRSVPDAVNDMCHNKIHRVHAGLPVCTGNKADPTCGGPCGSTNSGTKARKI